MRAHLPSTTVVDVQVPGRFQQPLLDQVKEGCIVQPFHVNYGYLMENEYVPMSI